MEFRRLSTGLLPRPGSPPLRRAPVPATVHGIPAAFDWRTKNAVTPVKDQVNDAWKVFTTQIYIQPRNYHSLIIQQIIFWLKNLLSQWKNVLLHDKFLFIIAFSSFLTFSFFRVNAAVAGRSAQPETSRASGRSKRDSWSPSPNRVSFKLG